MIKNYKYENGNESKVAEFGNGDLSVADFSDVENKISGIMVCDALEKHPIGSEGNIKKGDKISDVADFSILFTFSKTESIDVLLEALMNAKESLIEILDNKQF